MFRFLAQAIKSSSKRSSSPAKNRRSPARPQVESLEDRSLMSVVFFMNETDMRLSGYQTANHVVNNSTGTAQVSVTSVTNTLLTLNQAQFDTFNKDANPMIRVRDSGGALAWYLWDTRFASPSSNGEERTYVLNLKRTADPQGRIGDLGLRYRGFEGWQGFNVRWLQDKNDNWYYVTRAGVLNRWDKAKWDASTATGAARLQASSQPIAAVDPAAYQDPELLKDTPRGQTDSPQALKERLGFKTDGNFHQSYGGLNLKWIQDRNNNWYFITPSGRISKWDGTPNRATGTFIGTLDPSVYLNPRLLTNATSLSDPTELKQQFGFHVADNGNLYQSLEGKNARWFLDRNNTWYYITTGGDIYRRGPAGDVKVATVASDTWSNLDRLVTGLEKSGDWIKIKNAPTKIAL